MAYLQTGTWQVDGNGSRGDLIIQGIDSRGRVSGTIYGQSINGWWDEDARRITFLRVPNQQDPRSEQTFDGYAWDEPAGADTDFFLAGSFETYAGGGGSAKRPTYGWFARMHRVG
jgi:hypothetical protein